MTTKRPGRPKADEPRDLRAALLATSRRLLESGGPAALSLREVARQTGCTHQAPYHHFADRESILAALVTDGFDELAARLRAANDLAATSGVREALVASGRAYVSFALSQPGVFRIMFRPDVCNPARFPALREAGARAHGELLRLTRIAEGDAAGPAMATLLWAHVHGMACLLVDGPLGPQLPSERARQAHVREVGERFADLVLASGRPAGRRAAVRARRAP